MMPALDQGRLGPRFHRRPLQPYSLAMPQHGGAACHPSSSVSVKIFCFWRLSRFFRFRSILSFCLDTPREIYCFGVLANPRFRRSERSAFGIISRCKRSCLGSSRFPLVNPVQRVKIIIRLGGKRSPTKGTGTRRPKRETGGRGVAADTDTTTDPKRKNTHIHT